MREKLYVITRTDLATSQQAVQAGHAVAEYVLEHEDSWDEKWDNGTLVYLGIKNEDELKSLTKALGCANIPYTSFQEPDYGNQLTAIASLGSNHYFKRMQLL